MQRKCSYLDELIKMEVQNPAYSERNYVVHVKLIGILASAAGARQLDMKVVGPQTLTDLISGLLKTVGKRHFEEYLVDSGSRDPRPNVIILLNDQDCSILGGLQAVVQPDSTVTIIPVAHGG